MISSYGTRAAVLLWWGGAPPNYEIFHMSKLFTSTFTELKLFIKVPPTIYDTIGPHSDLKQLSFDGKSLLRWLLHMLMAQRSQFIRPISPVQCYGGMVHIVELRPKCSAVGLINGTILI